MTEEIFHPSCPVCGSTDTGVVLEAKDYTVSREIFAIRQCRACTLRFTWPVPDEQHIGRYYHSENYISHSDTTKGLINKLYHTVRKISLKQKKHWIEKSVGLTHGNILDIGCGTGAFLHVMQQSGWEVTGLEPDEGARYIAHNKYGLTTLSSGSLYDLPKNKFHAITLWHVMEHIHDLNGYINQIFQLLHDKGHLFIAVPNYTSLDAGIYQQYWAAYDVPRHLYHFSPGAMRTLIGQHGLKLKEMRAMPFDTFYISLLSEKYKTGRDHYLLGFINGLRSWTYANMQVEHSSSLLYILSKQELIPLTYL